MTQVTFKRFRGVYTLRLDGHAGYNPGNDVVCAGISAIVFALMGYVENFGKKKSIEYSSGRAEIRAKGCKKAFDMAYIGLRQIEMQYPENLQVTEQT